MKEKFFCYHHHINLEDEHDCLLLLLNIDGITTNRRIVQTVGGINQIDKSIRDMATALMKKMDKEGYDIHVVKNIRSAVKERLWPTTKFLPEDMITT